MNSGNSKVPKIGVVANSIGAFSPQGKEVAEEQMRAFLKTLKQEGLISEDSIFYPDRVFDTHEADKVLEEFIPAKIDALVILNSAFPNGNMFLTMAANPYFWRIPLIVTSPPEIDLNNREWTTNAYCGVIMNNYVAKRLGRHIFTLAGWPQEEDYQAEFKRLLRIVHTIKALRKDIVGRIGDAPGGFHSATGDQLAYARMFGTRVETVDLTQVGETFHSGKAKGFLGTAEFTQQQVDETYKKMTSVTEVITGEERVKNCARLYHALKALIEANGFTSISVRCWPELTQTLKVSACFSLAWLLSEGVVRSAACEGDWPNAICQSMGTLLSGKPSVCLDLVNDLAAKSTVQLGHCGVGIPSLMVEAKLSEIAPDRQSGSLTGPACIGQFEYGVKTSLSLIQDRAGDFKMLVFTGENKPETRQDILYAAADIEMKNYRQLNDIILKHGFTHHLAVAFGDVSRELKLLCDFYGIQYFNPDEC